MFRLGKAGGAGLVQEWQAGERFGWLGGLWHGRLMHGVFRFGWLGKLRLGVAWLVSESCGLAGVERLGRVRPVTVRCGLAGYKRRYNLWSTNGKMRHGLSPMPK